MQEGIQPPPPVDLRIHDEADGARTRELEDDGIDPREVIWQQEKSPRRQPLRMMRRDAVDASREQRAAAADEKFEEGGRSVHEVEKGED